MCPSFSGCSFSIAAIDAYGYSITAPFRCYTAFTTATNHQNGFGQIVLLMLASQRIESVVGNWLWAANQNQSTVDTEEEVPTKRGATPTAIEWMILAWVSGKFVRVVPYTMSYFLLFFIRVDME